MTKKKKATAKTGELILPEWMPDVLIFPDGDEYRKQEMIEKARKIIELANSPSQEQDTGR